MKKRVKQFSVSTYIIIFLLAFVIFFSLLSFFYNLFIFAPYFSPAQYPPSPEPYLPPPSYAGPVREYPSGRGCVKSCGWYRGIYGFIACSSSATDSDSVKDPLQCGLVCRGFDSSGEEVWERSLGYPTPIRCHQVQCECGPYRMQ